MCIWSLLLQFLSFIFTSADGGGVVRVLRDDQAQQVQGAGTFNDYFIHSTLPQVSTLFDLPLRSQDDLLADIGDSSPLDAAEEGNATPHASSAGTAVVTPQQAHTSHHASDDAQDGVQDGGVEALLSGVSGADVVLQESAPSNVEAEEADANSSEASNASAPVSAAPSSADLAQLVSQNEETDNELLLHQQQERRASEEEDGERDSPAKRARLE